MSERTRTRTGVVVCACHPALGLLYWELVDESSVGAEDYCSISQSMERALLLEPGWRDTDRGFYSRHLQEVLRQHVEAYHDPEYWGCGTRIIFSDALNPLQEQSGQTEEEFLNWLKSAKWVDVPGPSRIERTVDHGLFESWEVVSQTYPANDLVLEAIDSAQA